ncbi:hypothetical protein ACJ41O_010964 [Fusarium nematophilum]
MEPVSLAASCVTLAAVCEGGIRLTCNVARLPKKARKLQKKLESHIRHMKKLQERIERSGDSELTRYSWKPIIKAERALSELRNKIRHLNWKATIEDDTWEQMRAWLRCLSESLKYVVFPGKLDKFLQEVVGLRAKLEKIHEKYMLQSRESEKEKAGQETPEVPDEASRENHPASEEATKSKTPIIVGVIVGAVIGGIPGAVLGGVNWSVGGAVAGGIVGGLIGWWRRK